LGDRDARLPERRRIRGARLRLRRPRRGAPRAHRLHLREPQVPGARTRGPRAGPSLRRGRAAGRRTRSRRRRTGGGGPRRAPGSRRHHGRTRADARAPPPPGDATVRGRPPRAGRGHRGARGGAPRTCACGRGLSRRGCARLRAQRGGGGRLRARGASVAESRGLKRWAWPALAWGVGLAGLAYRIRELGRYGFWNDEAWVALSTRVQGVAQFRLSLGPTPVLWAATLRLLAPLPLAPEVALGLTLSVGVALANAQLFVGPPLLGALLADAIATEDWPRARAVVAAGVAVGAWDLAYFKILVAPHLTASLAEYWDNAYVTGSADQAARFVVRTLQAMLGATWSGLGMVLALPSLVALFVRVRATRPVLLAIVLLIAELAWLSSRRLVPFNASRVMLFLLTVLNVHLAMAFGFAASQLWSRRALWPLAPLLLALLVRAIALRPNWARLGLVEQAENLGPLVRIVEESR